ncbi:MAG: hypothetical protein IKE46_08060 [Selenomonadaceae bacterium]|nr:hypothetical protein [Selenomonadaceae bacterium]MBR4384142.1 hypothetical protein [Selenomonadaceae bacterium]
MKSSELFDIMLLIVTALCIVITAAIADKPIYFLAGICYGSSLTISLYSIYKRHKNGAD